jgi:hypothetical protein
MRELMWAIQESLKMVKTNSIKEQRRSGQTDEEENKVTESVVG